MLNIPFDWDKPKTWSRKKVPESVLEVRKIFEINNRHQICKRLGSPKTRYSYFRGLKSCITCNVNYDTDDLFCPCCKRRLRIHRRCKTKTHDYRPRYE